MTVRHLICDEALRTTLTANLSQFEPQQQNTALKHAAVAIVIVDTLANPKLYDMEYHESWANHAAIVLTVRSSKLSKHSGQWALPGGRLDAGETPEEAALRELEEEVGLQLTSDQIIGRLDDYTTRSGFNITPIVVWGGSRVEMTANPDEVETIYRIPLNEFMREDAPITESIPESKHPVLKMPLGNSWFAAPTAAIIYQFREVALAGRNTRVAHFEQPYFAWK